MASKEDHPFAMGSALLLAALAVLIVAFSMMATGPAAVLIAAVSSGAFGFWLGRREGRKDRLDEDSPVGAKTPIRTPRTPKDRRTPSAKLRGPFEQAEGWMLRKAEADSKECVRMRFVHINDVYEMDNLPKLKSFLDECLTYLPENNLIVSVGGDLLSPYPLSTLDKGLGMVEVMLCSGVRYACFGNHEADVGLDALKKRVQEWISEKNGGIWINTNMLQLSEQIELPYYSPVTVESKDGHHKRTVCLLGACTVDEGLYCAGEDFGGAVYSADTPNKACIATADELMGCQKPPDGIVALTHQDLEDDMQLAQQARDHGIYAVLGGHDHTEEAAMLDDRSCVVLKSGMDAKKAAVMDLVWQTAEDKEPSIDVYTLIDLKSYADNSKVSKRVTHHMQKVWEMEARKALVHLTVFREKPLMSSKNVRTQQTTLGSFLCSALRDELEVDCVLFDGGNIRGDRDYIPNLEHYLGNRWTFTLADLEQELPWSSEMVIIVMKGHMLDKVLRDSRVDKFDTGGFLQADGGVHVNDPKNSTQKAFVAKVGNEPLLPDRLYRVGVMYASLSGMNGHPVFEEYRKEKTMPQEDAGKPAKELLKKQFARRMWDEMPEFHEINGSKSGVLSREEVKAKYKEKFSVSRRPEAAIDASLDQLLAVADADENGNITSFKYEAIFRLPTWITLAEFSAEQKISSKNSTTEQTSMGSFLCDALKKELEVECVLFDGGNIRGNHEYTPVPGHRRGPMWAFTVRDLRHELPWPSEMATVTMTGQQISKAVQLSRAKKGFGAPKERRPQNIPDLKRKVTSSGQLAGGFLQCDSGIQVSTENQVTHIAGKPVDMERRYKVGVLYHALMGMNLNPVFGQLREEALSAGNRVVQGPHARALLTRHFLRGLWKDMQKELDKKGPRTKEEEISRDELLASIKEVWPRAGGNIRRSLLRRLLSTVVTEDGTGSVFKSSGITYREYQNTLSKVSHEHVKGRSDYIDREYYSEEGNEAHPDEVGS